MKKSTFIFAAILAISADAIKIDHPKYVHSQADLVHGRYIVSTASTQFTSPDITIHETFAHELFQGVSLSIDNESTHLSTLISILDRPDIEAVYPVKMIARPTVKYHPSTQHSVLPHAMTQVDKVHSKLKNKGKGILVGILDTGIDYTHPALGEGFGEGFKVTKGYDIVGDAYTGANTPVPDDDPLDACGAGSGAEGHGTHVSGIIAGYDASTVSYTTII